LIESIFSVVHALYLKKINPHGFESLPLRRSKKDFYRIFRNSKAPKNPRALCYFGGDL
jgi:hypothetical protein